MRPIARQSARLASQSRASSCSRVRHSSTPRYTSPQHIRAFNSTPRRASESRPPNGNGDHNDRIEQRREEQRKNIDEAATKPEQAKETENGETKSTNGESRKPGMSRRTLRQRRVTEVPKPPPIPDWFLKHNVYLLRDVLSQRITGTEEVVKCVDADTGHTLFTVPYYEPPVEKRMMVKVRGNDVDITALELDNDIRRLPDHLREEMMIHHLQVQRAKRPEEVDLEALGELLVALPRDMQEEILRREAVEGRRAGRDETADYVQKSHATQLGKEKKRTVKRASSGSLGQNFFDQKVTFQQPTAGTKASTKSSATFGNATNDTITPFSWVLLEAETSIRSALALPTSGQPTASFASSRVDLSLHCPDNDSHAQMDTLVNSLAQTVQADVIRLDANDFEELTNEYVGQGQDSPGSFSTLGYDVFDGLVASNLSPGSRFLGVQQPPEDDDEFDMDEDEFDEDEDEEDDDHSGPSGSGKDFNIRKALFDGRQGFVKALSDMGVAVGRPQIISVGPDGPRESRARRASRLSQSSGEFVQWNDERLSALLDSLLDAAKQKRDTVQPSGSAPPGCTLETGTLSRVDAARMLVGYLPSGVSSSGNVKLQTEQLAQPSPSTIEVSPSPSSTSRTIIHVRDLKNIFRNNLGDTIVRRLVKVVRKRRAGGESIMIVGTTAQTRSESIFMSMGGLSESSDAPFRNITVPSLFDKGIEEVKRIEAAMQPGSKKTLSETGYPRILEINLRHLQSMLRRLRPSQEVDLVSSEARKQLSLPGTSLLAEKVLSLDEVQRLVLTAIGLSQSHAHSDIVVPVHIALAIHVTSTVDQVVQAWTSSGRAAKLEKGFRAGSGKGGSGTEAKDSGDSSGSKVEEIRRGCNAHETRLLTGVVDARNIKTAFADVHAPPATIEALKTLTTLSLLRPEAFSYGVLASDRLPGLLLYGPPGTGKTMLAKAVAKESKATVLEISGAQIYEKYVGEGEKMVRAVFSLAKKLSPCVVFIDEADAIFGSRSGAGNRNTHREIINQFLREWDGMDDHSVFMMVASNRPFDLDDAVLRRLPRRLLVDLPVAKDRESILGIHLKNELLDSSVNLAKLAEETPLYSGSDLKNLCVAAALACVREENGLLTTRKDDKDFKLPDKRTLTSKHFETAVKEISASISEDMSSLTAIRKFDEQFGDRRGRRKKAGFGFGKLEGAIDEMSVRVRQPEQSSPPPP